MQSNAPGTSYRAMAEPEVRQRLAAILAADVVGYSRLMGDDERATIAAINRCRAVFREHIEANSGRVVDMAGDAVLAVFASVSGAVTAGLAAQQALQASNEALDEGRVRLRLDVTSLLGRVQVEKVEGKRIEADFHVMARTGNLERTRVQREGSGKWREIVGAVNPNTGSTAVELVEELEVEVGEWVSLVDYVEGDAVLFEPVCRG